MALILLALSSAISFAVPARKTNPTDENKGRGAAPRGHGGHRRDCPHYGQSITRQGRETQIYRKTQGSCGIIHVHYSGMPSTQPGQGF